MKQFILNPFIKIAGFKALAIGLVFTLFASWTAGTFSARYDGVLDIHFADQSSFLQALYDNLINIFCLTFFFYGIAFFLCARKPRFIDILGTSTMARAPIGLIPLTNIGNISGGIGEKLMAQLADKSAFTLTAFEIIYLVLSTLLILLIIVWYVSLLYRAYTVSTNLKGKDAVGSFIAAIILAEISSKILIYYLV